ncbi:MAG: hypothetical protein IT385_07045 [Deltaproteobacteria bacterium]|nr:hypothetical protein [Deltaproteobacteria bacterium]
MADFKGFKRINFFTGFQTTADDWNDLVKYGVEKHKLHNRLLHGPGVVPNVLGGLKVSARGRADRSVEISPGYAIDGEGNEIYVPEPTIKTIDPGDFKLPQTVYIVVKYIEELTDFVSYKANLEYKGHRRIAEAFKIEAIITEPDIRREVELARIHMTKDVKRITDSKDPLDPKPNELDLNFVPLAGQVGSHIDKSKLNELAGVLSQSKAVYSHMYNKMRILSAGSVEQAMNQLDMLLRCGLVDERNLYDLFATVFTFQEELVADVEANYPQYSSKKEFASFKKHIELLQGMYKEKSFNTETMVNTLGYQKKSTENRQLIFGGKVVKKAVETTQKTADETILLKLKEKSDDFGEFVEVEGVKLKRIDVIDILEKQSEQDHKFRIVDAKDKYRTRQKLKYPDGVIVEDVGIAYEGGYAEWEISNVTPNKEIFMFMRMDYVHGGWEAEISVNGKKTGAMVCEGEDRKFRWRNWPFKIGAEYVTDTFLTIRQTPNSADRDVNMFKLWFYQPA